MVDHNEQHDSGWSPNCHAASRRDHPTYRVATRLARAHGADAATALFAGMRDCPFLSAIDWDSFSPVIDLDRVARGRVLCNVLDDFSQFEPSERFDLVFWLDSLEQVPEPARFLRKLMRMCEVVVVSVPYKWPHDPGSGRQNDPIDEVKLQQWARRRWVESEVVDHEGRTWLVAVFRETNIGTAAVACDFGESDDDRSWLRGMTASIDAVCLPRRRPRFAETVTARLYQDDPLRQETTGTFGVYVVRALWNALGFDEHRKFNWRLEHKLVQARAFNHYLGCEFPMSWGCDALVRRGLGEPLVDALLSRKLFAKEALGHLSGDYGEAESAHDVLSRLILKGEFLPNGTPCEEQWLVQERIPIEREYRVHSLEDLVLPCMTFDRYGPFPVPDARAEVNAYVASILARLPDAMVGESLYAWDIARLADGRFRVIEANLVGFHPVYERGFQVSGFFQYHPLGPPLLVELARHVASTYNVALELSGAFENEPNRHALYLRVFRHYLDRQSVPLEPASPCVPAGPSPERLDAVISLRAEELERFALLRESIDCTGARFGTFYVAVPDADLAAISASHAVAGPSCVLVSESELVPEAAEFPNAPPGVRRQIARLALVARTGGDFCFDLCTTVVSVRRFQTSDLIRGGKALVSRAIKSEHAELYAQAEALLGLRRSGWVHGITPFLLNKWRVADLVDYLQMRFSDAPDGQGSWRRVLLGRRGWMLGHIYFTFLEAFGLEERDYFPAEWNIADNCVWSSEDWADWDPAASFDEYSSFYFTVVQVGPDVPAEAVRRRFAPYLGLTSNGGARRSES